MTAVLTHTLTLPNVSVDKQFWVETVNLVVVMRYSFLTRLLDFVSPRLCCICGERLAVSEDELCGVCNMRLPRTMFHLHAYDNPLAKLFWGRINIEKAVSLFYYEPGSMVSRLIYALKYFDHPDIGVVMGRLFGDELLKSGFFNDIDVIVPVPLAKKRLRQRGYNQSDEIAAGLGEASGVAVDKKAVSRLVFTDTQTNLNFIERQVNVEDAFAAGETAELYKGKHILLVDDIVTTGATLVACAAAFGAVADVRFSIATLGFTHSSSSSV